MRKRKEMLYTDQEQNRINEQLSDIKSQERNEWSLFKSVSELYSATVNQAVIDVLSPPETINSLSTKALAYRESRIKSRDAKGALDFIESENLDVYLLAVKKLGGSSANSRRIRKLTRDYLKQGKHIYINNSSCRVMTAREWCVFQAESKRKWSKTYIEGKKNKGISQNDNLNTPEQPKQVTSMPESIHPF